MKSFKTFIKENQIFKEDIEDETGGFPLKVVKKMQSDLEKYVKSVSIGTWKAKKLIDDGFRSSARVFNIIVEENETVRDSFEIWIHEKSVGKVFVRIPHEGLLTSRQHKNANPADMKETIVKTPKEAMKIILNYLKKHKGI